MRLSFTPMLQLVLVFKTKFFFSEMLQFPTEDQLLTHLSSMQLLHSKLNLFKTCTPSALNSFHQLDMLDMLASKLHTCNSSTSRNAESTTHRAHKLSKDISLLQDSEHHHSHQSQFQLRMLLLLLEDSLMDLSKLMTSNTLRFA
jgi:hypothetical protein